MKALIALLSLSVVTQAASIEQYKVYSEQLKARSLQLIQKSEQLEIVPGCVDVAFDQVFKADFEKYKVYFQTKRILNSSNEYLLVNKCSGTGKNSNIIQNLVYNYNVESAAWLELYRLELEVAAKTDPQAELTYNNFISSEKAKVEALKKDIASLEDPNRNAKEIFYTALGSVGGFASVALWLSVAVGGFIVLTGATGGAAILVLFAAATGVTYGTVKSYDQIDQIKVAQITETRMKLEIESRVRVLQATTKSQVSIP